MLRTTIINLWHTSRAALAGIGRVPTAYDRMLYVKEALNKHYPQLVEGLSPKKIWFEIQEAIN